MLLSIGSHSMICTRGVQLEWQVGKYVYIYIPNFHVFLKIDKCFYQAGYKQITDLEWKFASWEVYNVDKMS